VHQQQLDLASDNAYLWGALMAIVVAHKTGSVYWTIGLGMLIFMVVGL
jgi:branched-subunit amino acid transport protein